MVLNQIRGIFRQTGHRGALAIEFRPYQIGRRTLEQILAIVIMFSWIMFLMRIRLKKFQPRQANWEGHDWAGVPDSK